MMKNATKEHLLKKIELLKAKVAELENTKLKINPKIDELKENERLKLVLEGANIGWCDWDISTGKETYNEILPNLLGYKHSEMPKSIIWGEGIIHPEDFKKVKKDIQKHFDGETEFYKNKHRLKTKSGEWKWFFEHGKVIERDKFGKPARMIVTLNDIDKHYRAEKAMQISENKFRTIYENAPILIDSFDKDGRCVLWNKECERVFGWTIDEINSAGNTLALFYHDEEEYNRVYESILVKPTGQFREWHPYTKSGKKLTTRWANFEISEGLIINMGYDITMQKLLEAEREVNQKEIVIAKEKAEESDRLKTAFLQNLSHEIRTPLNGILGFAELIKMSGLSPEDLEEYIAIIEKSGSRLLNTISDLMDISMIVSGQIDVNVSNINVEKLITALFSKFHLKAKKKGISLVINNSFQFDEIIVSTDGQKVRTILNKLLSNAIKFTKVGGVEFGYIVHEYGKSTELQFFVKDSGIGIPKNRLSTVFDRFMQVDFSSTRDFEGSGLGLSIIKEYVEMLNGKIWLESEVGTGSQFYFTLPCDIIKKR